MRPWVEDRTICSRRREDGPTNNWMEPDLMKKKQRDCDQLYEGRTCMSFRSAWRPGLSYARYGVQITDSEYVVVNMRIMTRMGEEVLPFLQKKIM